MASWLDRERRDILTAQLLTPSGYSDIGWLEGVTGGSITDDHDTDTRIAATITTIAPETDVDLAMMRLWHEARFSDGDVQTELLGTFFALRTSEDWKSGTNSVTFDLKSALYGLSSDIAPTAKTLGKDSFARAAFEAICKECRRPYAWLDADNRRFSANKVLEAGKSNLSRLHELANMSGNRLDVDEQGRLTFQKYVRPRNRSVVMELEHTSPMVLSSGISRSTDEMEVPSRAIVTWNHSQSVRVKGKSTTQQKAITAYADVDAGAHSSIGRRGFRVATYHQEDDLGTSTALAQQMARKYLDEEDEVSTTWTVPCRWFPIKAGQCISWLAPDADVYRKCLVTRVERDLTTFTQQLTLREV